MEMQKKKIPKLLVVTHGSFGEEIIKSAEMIIGKQKNIKAVSLFPGVDLGEFLVQIKNEINEASDEVLILCDLFGGTPSNVSASLLSEYNAYAVTGLNLAMLIEACTMRETLNGWELVKDVLNAATIGCKNLNKEIKNMEDSI
jgi:mannose/fructose/sorbose-specific phosphotransferase system IIA component